MSGAAWLIGWHLQEPWQSDERLPLAALLLALPVLGLWCRAGIRAARSARSTRPAPAATVGLLRPRVVIDPRLRRELDAAGLRAVEAHERAHARHFDPLRIWLAQLLTDLQWPAGAARVRFQAWLEALEIARDDEALAEGVPGVDLAHAIVTAARLTDGHRHDDAYAGLTGAEHALRARVERLLGAPPPVAGETGSRARALSLVLVAAAMASAVLLGVYFGEAMIRRLPFVSV
jgi:beta-lactamase regulating signal transducer with metallopeptidase domain